MSQLHRVSVKRFDPVIGRLVYENSPWHPNKAYVDSFVGDLYNTVGVFKISKESINLDISSPSKDDDKDIPNLDDILGGINLL